MSWQAAVVHRLIEQKAITPEQAESAREEGAKTGVPLVEVIQRRGYVAEKALAMAIAEACEVPFVDLMNYTPDRAARDLLSEKVAREHDLFPLFRIDNTLTVAMKDPTDILALDAARGRSALLVDPVVSALGAIRVSIDRLYSGVPAAPADAQPEEVRSDGGEPEAETGEEPSREPVPTEVVQEMVEMALHEGASDIHIEPTENGLDIRFRVDGTLRMSRTLPKSVHPGVVSRIKILANLDIAETRLPQDGRFRQAVEGRAVDLRVSSVPTIHGENVVIRLLDTRMTNVGLPQLGMAAEVQALYERLARMPYGLLLVTGPTGTGKTTTLYATLSILNTPDRHIITIEDPVEYRLPGIRQIQVNDRVGLKFANGLRSIVRQDPDVIMVGEIRDRETAEIAIQSALTGHFVLSTLHTNDAPSTLLRLLDMGVEPFLICSSVVGVASQRLVRTLCADCKEPYVLPESATAALGLSKDDPRQFFRGRGCQLCKSSGHRGRMALFEVMRMTEEIRAVAARRGSADEIRAVAMRQGMVTLSQDGLEKARQGLTTVEEVLRVTRFA